MTTALAFSLAAALSGQTMTTISGTVTIREKIALPESATVTVSLSRYGANGGQTMVSEIKLVLNGRQLPVAFVLPYQLGKTEKGETFGVTARILDGGKVLFETDRAAMVIANNKSRAELTLVKPAPTPAAWKMEDREWTLRWMEGREVKAERPPTLKFVSTGNKVEAFAGVNRMGGSYQLEASLLQVDPGAMTKMAGPPELMDLEQNFVRLLQLVNRRSVEEGELVLRRGDVELLRFVSAKK